MYFYLLIFTERSGGGSVHRLPKRVGFLRRFALKTSIDLAQFGLESGMVFEGTTVVYEPICRFNSK